MKHFNPCILIPVYNHPDALARQLEQLKSYGLNLILVDDGSNQATASELERLRALHDFVRLFRLPLNQGKGAAVCRGFREAAALGHTHVIQIDADGQHEIRDLPRFIAAAEAHPSCQILGKPIFGPEAPTMRVRGRKISQFWVWIETLSLEIGDPLFGFRCYPLEATIALLDQIQLGNRMDFDPEICVRLHWRGVRARNIETKVTYPQDGLSHFHMFRDNLRITWLHIRLVLGMLPRAPRLLLRNIRAARSRERRK